MKTPREGTIKIRNNLLRVAGELFAARGYRDVTVADICERAGVNIAAVNYHFGDKETLYKEAWRQSFSESIQMHPPDGGVSEDAPPEERLQGMITALLRRISDENCKEFRIMQKEISNPTGLLKEISDRELKPLQRRTAQLVRHLLGNHALEAEVWFCEMSIISQCLNPVVVESGATGKQRKKGSQGMVDITTYASHVVNFSLGGIQAIRGEAEKRSRKKS